MHTGLKRIKDTLEAIQALQDAEEILETHDRKVSVDGMASLMQKLLDSLEEATKAL